MKIAILLTLLAVACALPAQSDIKPDIQKQANNEENPRQSTLKPAMEQANSKENLSPKPQNPRLRNKPRTKPYVTYPDPVPVPCDDSYPAHTKCWWHPAPVYHDDD